MQQAVRIIVNNPLPLDGVTDLDLTDPGVSVTQDAELGLTIITLDSSLSFGRFVPGEVIGAGDSQGTYNLLSVALVPTGGVPAAGSACRLVSPELPSTAVRTLDIADLGVNSGIYPKLIETIPVGHKLAFETPAPGGPWVIQCLFDRIKTAQAFLSLTPTALS